MKELKNISLKEEIDREAKETEKEVSSRTDLDGLKVSEDMETSLFNKIQDYEYDRRLKTVYRKKKKVRVVMALAAVLVIVFGCAVTGVGSKSYWKVIWDRVAGGENLSYIDVDKMNSQDTEDLDEVYIYKEIRNKLGISPVGLEYLPEKTYFIEYELDEQQKKATLLYQNNEQIIRYVMYMNNSDSSYGQTKTDELVNEYFITLKNNISINIKEYLITETKQHRYIGKFEYKDAQYQLEGTIEKEEFEKILKNLKFYKE